MSDINFTWSDGGLQKCLESLKGKEIRRIEKKAMRKGAAQISRQAKGNFKKSLPAATQSSPKYNDKLIDAIKSTVFEENNEMYFKVHVMGTGKKGSGTFRARFFEKGTKDRNSDGHNRGKIEPLNFFSNAVSQTSNKAYQAINQTFTQGVEELINKKYKEDKI
jgi:HK97 gp10 family phage protein